VLEHCENEPGNTLGWIFKPRAQGPRNKSVSDVGPTLALCPPFPQFLQGECS